MSVTNLEDIEDEFDPIEALLEGPYQDGLWEGMRCKKSYIKGLLACPYKKGSSREEWLTGFEVGYFIQTSR